MKALCVRQPWAEAIASGMKGTEWRSWPTGYRGRLLIVASQAPDPTERDLVRERRLPLGVTVCLVDLLCVEKVLGVGGEVLFAWTLRNVRRVKASPVRGRLGLFEVEDELVEVLP